MVAEDGSTRHYKGKAPLPTGNGASGICGAEAGGQARGEAYLAKSQAA